MKPLVGCAKDCADWKPYGDVPASGPLPPGRMLRTTALPGCTARSSRRKPRTMNKIARIRVTRCDKHLSRPLRRAGEPFPGPLFSSVAKPA